MMLRGIGLLGEWTKPELDELMKILEPLPPAWVENNPHLHTIWRQPVLTDGPPEAPGHSKYEPLLGSIVVFDKGVYHGEQIDSEQFRRSVCHELAHSLLRGDPSLIRDWKAETQGDGFVDDYAKTSPDEDFCDTFSEVFIDPDGTRRLVPRKAGFIERRRARAQQEKVAMHFLRGFTNELVKTAGSSFGRMMRFGRAEHAAAGAKGMGRMAKGLLIGGGVAGAGVAGELLGKKRGEQQGYSEGTTDTLDVAERARLLGRREGILAYHEALQARMKQAGE